MFAKVLRDSIDMFNELVKTPSIEILYKKSRNIIITTAYLTLKGNNKLRKNFCENFLNNQEMVNKAPFLKEILI